MHQSRQPLELIDDLFAPAPVIEIEPLLTLRHYQERCVAKDIEIFESRAYRRVLNVLATGTGKTVIFSHLTRHFTGKGWRVLVLAHTDELCDQARKTLQRVVGFTVAKEKATERATLHDRVVVGSVATLRGERLASWPRDHFQLIIVDETDLVMAPSWLAILNHFENACVLGVTATVDRGDKQALAEVFETLPPECEYGLFKAVRDGWLVRPVGHPMSFKIDLGAIDVQAGDFATNQVEARLIPYLDGAARCMWDEARDLKTMVFLPTVRTAQMMAESLTRAGFRADCVFGADEERSDKIARFKSGDIQVITNPYMLTRGFDHDGVDGICCLRPTRIPSLYKQIVGRGTRPLQEIIPLLNAAPDAAARKAIIAASRKPSLKILDFLFLFDKHRGDLVRPASLVAPNEEVAARMSSEGDLMENEEAAERDLFESLEKAFRKAANRKSTKRVIDPFAAALAAGDDDALAYEPFEAWEKKEATEPQLKLIKQFGIDAAKIRDRGHAKKVLDWVYARKARGLCMPGVLMWLRSQNIDASAMTQREARQRMQERLAELRERRAGQKRLNL